MAEQSHQLQLHYSSQADAYAASDETKWKTPTEAATLLEELCERHRFNRILELGVGTGRYFPFLRGSEYYGVDVCDPMLSHARRRESILKRRGFSNIHLIHQDIEDFLAQQTSKFDFVFSIGCLGFHLPVTTALMRNIAERMAPHGYLFLQTTQRSLGWTFRRQLRYWRNLLTRRQDNFPFFCASTPDGLHRAARAAHLNGEWMREGTGRWYDKPMLYSLFRKN